MIQFTYSDIQRIENAVEYTKATILPSIQGKGVCSCHIGRLHQSKEFLESADYLTETILDNIILKGMPSRDMFFCRIQISFLLAAIEGYVRMAQSEEDFRDSEQDPEPKKWVAIPEDMIKTCSDCFDKDHGILAKLKLVCESPDVTIEHGNEINFI